jgi:DNA invertase Pin-like site-specific DNA recombinase
MTNFRVYAYLRASTKEQDANRAKDTLIKFAADSNLKISTFFVENESGATLNRPELFRLLDIAESDDILLVEQIDRISRLNDKDWNHLKTIIDFLHNLSREEKFTGKSERKTAAY